MPIAIKFAPAIVIGLFDRGIVDCDVCVLGQEQRLAGRIDTDHLSHSGKWAWGDPS
jgi:hypothetical protein